MNRHRPNLFHRDPGNPVLTAADWPSAVNSVFNPGATTFEGETLLLVRVEDRRGVSHLGVARSAEGHGNWLVEPERALLPELHSEAERFGIEDPRITKSGDDYLIVYTGFSTGGPVIRLAVTRDFRSYERRGTIMPPEDKDGALFPEPIGGRYALIHRPVSATPLARGDIWLSWSPDLRHWGDPTPLLRARSGAYWDSAKVGLGPPPLLTDRGWLICFHGTHDTAAGSIYRAGLALLDRDDPSRLLARSDEWLFGPEAPYERTGDVSQVVFPTGWVVGDDGDTVRIYYGAADTSVCVATASVAELLDWLDAHAA